MNNKIALLILLIFVNTLWAATEVAAPVNDNFVNAIPLTCGNNYTTSTAEATLDEDDAPDSTNPVVDLDAPNIWYSYTGSGTAEIVTLDLCASGYDTSYLIYTGTSGNLTLVAANDDNEPQCGAGYRSYGTFQSDGTTTYYITITGYGPTDIGTVDLTVSCLPAQAVLIPDPNFEQALIDLGIDSGTVNGYVLPAAVDQVVDLNVSGKNISDLTGIEAFTALKTLDCSINNLTNLDVSQNLLLEDLKAFANQLTNLDISQNLALEFLRVFDNSQLSNIEFPVNGSLIHLTMSTNTQLTNIDFSQIPTLETLYAINCGFTSLDLSGNPALKRLDLSQNPLLSLDLSANPALTEISCDNMSSLVYLNVQNGTNSTNVMVFNTLSTPNLSCIQVDNVAYSTSTWTQVDAGVNFAAFCDPITYVPDDNFEQYLIDEGYDTVLDNAVVTANVNAITDVNVSNKSIADLTGIEAFTSLKTLNCNGNNLTNLDVSQNVALETLKARTNNLSANLDVSQNLVLEVLEVMDNSQLSNIELPVNGNLRFLIITNTQIANIDLTQTPALDNLYATNSGLTSLDLSGNPALATLVLGQNPLVSLDLSANPALAIFSCQNMSSLAYLNVQNGANTSMLSFNTLSNPNLSCIQVDDVAYSTSNWTQIDAGVNFTVFCDPVTYVPDDNFEQYLIDEGYDNLLDNHVITSNISSVEFINVSNKNIADLTGIEDFTALKFLYALNNQLTAINVTQNTALEVLQIGYNNISTIDLTQNSALENLNISTNNIATIDLTQNAVLENLNINTNNISTIDLTQNPLLKILTVSTNPLTTIDLTQNTALENLTLYNIQLATLDVSNNINLERLVIEFSPLTTIDLTQNVALNFLTLYDTQISTIDVSNNLNLEQFFIDSDVLTAIDVSANLALKSLYIWDTLIQSIDVSNNPVFENLSVQGSNVLTNVNVQNGNNSNFMFFSITNTPNLSCIQVDDVAYSTSNWTSIDLQTSFSEFCGDPIQLAAKVYLQGAMLQYTDGFMRTDLKDNNHVSAASSAYTDGIEASDNVFLATGQDKIVDWIWVELRDASDPTIIIDGKSALLQRDGDIVDATAEDVSTPLSFNQEAGDYYVVIKHRNHLGIMSNNALALSTTVTTVDFTDSNNQITYGTNAQTTFGMPANSVAMWCGNVNGDNLVQYSGTNPDVPTILSTVLNDAGNFLNFPTYVVSGYDTNDVNMDGNTQYAGTNPDTPFILQNIFAHPGNFLNFSTYQITEQLPQSE